MVVDDQVFLPRQKKLHNLGNIAMLLVPFCKMQSISLNCEQFFIALTARNESESKLLATNLIFKSVICRRQLVINNYRQFASGSGRYC